MKFSALGIFLVSVLVITVCGRKGREAGLGRKGSQGTK